MVTIFNITLPFFGLVFAGWIGVRSKVFSVSAVKELSGYVLYAALPAMLLVFVLRTPLMSLLDHVVIVVYGTGTVLTALAAFCLSRKSGGDIREAAFGALVAASPNTGFMGVSLVAVLLGMASVGPVIAAMLFDMLVTSTMCIALSEGHRRSSGSLFVAICNALRGVFANPLPWAIGAGIALSVLDWHLPAPLQAMAQMLADSGTPVALCTIGATLAIRSCSEGTSRVRFGSNELWYLAAVKVAIHPTMIWLVATLAVRCGFDMTSGQIRALVLAAALPSAGNAMLLAARYGADSSRIASIVLITTCVTPLTWPFLASLLGAG